MEDIFVMRESTKDKLAIAWAMFGASTIGVIFMIGNLPNLTRNVAKIYEITSSAYSIITPIIGYIFLSLIIFGIWEGKIKFKKRKL